MSSRTDRIGTVLRVRRIQEAQAAGETARAAQTAAETERVLGSLRQHYDRHRELDHSAGQVPDRLGDRLRREQQAQAIQRGRERVQAAVADLEARRRDLVVRTQAVRAMERLDERLRAERSAELARIERRDLDELALTGRTPR